MSFRKIELMDSYELLNLPANATADDIERACLRLASVYGENSLASYHAISDQQRQWIIGRIKSTRQKALVASAGKQKTHERATTGTAKDQVLINPHKTEGQASTEKKKPPAKVSAPVQLAGDKITGEDLKKIRRSKGASLDEIADITKVKKSYLEAIERGDKAAFPAPVFMKGFLKAYARALGLNPAEIAKKYMDK